MFAHERSTRINPQLFYYNGPFGLLAEYLWLRQGVQKGNTTAELEHQAAHGTVSFTLGGADGFDGVTPEHPFDPTKGHVGAFQLAARVGRLKLDDDTFPTYANPVTSARSATQVAGGFAWVPRRSVRLSVNYEQTRFEGGAGTAAMGTSPAVIQDRKTEHLVLGRAQVNF